jgi:hypothetical protein
MGTFDEPVKPLNIDLMIVINSVIESMNFELEKKQLMLYLNLVEEKLQKSHVKNITDDFYG